MNKTIRVTVTVITILTIIVFFGNQRYKTQQKNKQIIFLQKELAKRDSLFQVADGAYKKLVADYYTERELLEVLSQENKELHTLTKTLKAKVVYYQTLTMKPNDRVDTVYVRTTERDNVLSYYPDKEVGFIKYTRTYFDEYYIDNWKFNTLPISILIQEEQKGVFTSTIKGASWITISDMQVRSLPLDNITQKKLSFYTGLGLGYNLTDNYKHKVVSDVSVGIRYKNTLTTGRVSTDGVVGVGIGKFW